MKKKTVLVTIAHPDDEAFGPSGLIARISPLYDVHVICVTDGGSDSRFHALGRSLVPLRKQELIASANVLGVKKVHFLSYLDGSLCNNLYHDIATKMLRIAKRILPECIITNELRGVSGHLDHVAVAAVSSYVYREMESINAIIYNVARKEVSDAMREYFVFFPEGYDKKDVDLVVDISSVFETKLQAAACHATQKTDVERVTKRWKTLPKEEWYLVTKRRKSDLIASLS